MNNDAPSLYSLLPAYIRQRDQQSDKVLEQFLAIIDRQADALAADLDRMYQDWFIETCSDWVVPYIGDLMGFDAAAGSGRREVANLLRYRRRKGTVAVLEDLAGAVTGWPALATEFHRRVVIAQHMDHTHADRLATVDTRAMTPETEESFSAVCHVSDVHRISDTQARGLYGIPNVGVFVFRMKRFAVSDTPAYCQEDAGLNCFTFSVLGNDAPLYRLPDETAAARRHRLPLPIGRFELEAPTNEGARLAQADPAVFGPGRSLSIRVENWPGRGARGEIDAAKVIPADLTDWAGRVPPNHVAVDPVLGRIMFPARHVPKQPVMVSYGYGFVMDIGGGEYPRTLPPLPARLTRLKVSASDHRVAGEFATIEQAVAHWKSAPNAEPALLVELTRSGVYRGALDVTLEAGESLWIVARSGVRPVLWLSDENAGGSDAMFVRGAANSRFTLDGVLVAGRGLHFSPRVPEGYENGALDGANAAPHDLCQITIRHSTLVPGWGLRHDCQPRRPSEPSILLDSTAACVRIERSIVGAIRYTAERRDLERGSICIEDSIVDATSETRMAIGAAVEQIAGVTLTIRRSTLVGSVHAHAILLAEDSIFMGRVEVARRQIGCMRYSYVPRGSRTPVRHRCQPDGVMAAVDAKFRADPTLDPHTRERQRTDAALRVTPVFESVRYGTPQYLRLSSCVASEISQGAQDGELGVYHQLLEPKLLAMLHARLAEYVPAGACSAAIIAS
jgi:hypothetical protein